MFHAPDCLHRSHAFFLAAAGTMLVAACGPALLAPADSTITLTASAATISLSGSSSITATVLGPGGGNVPDGTMVSFRTTWGTIGAPQVRTRTGKAVSQLLGGSAPGTATVVASSGSAVSEGLQIEIGGVALTVTLAADSTTPAINSAVTLTATPSTGGPAVDHYEWNFGDPAGGSANTRTTATGSASYTYTAIGSKTITVKAVATDGTSATAQVIVVVQ
jgi:hypothetical protein